MPYHGPDPERMRAQFAGLQAFVGQSVTLRTWVSASTASTSAYMAGGGKTDSYRQQQITALMKPSQPQEAMAPGGMVMAGDMIASTPQALGNQDQLVWQGVTYRIEGDSLPIRAGGRLWYHTYIRRGDATG